MTIQDTEESNREVVQLRTITGGKQPPKKGDNWLSKVNQWAVFTAKNINISRVDLFMFQVREKYANTTFLTVLLPSMDGKPITRPVSTYDFSEDYELMDIVDDGSDHFERRLPVDAKIEKDDQVV